MKKLVLIGLLLMLIATLFVFSESNPAPANTKTTDYKKAEMTRLAKEKYDQFKQSNSDLKKGPCLGAIAVGWVADLVHNPRESVDDEPLNKCSEFRRGEKPHLVELDLEGNLVEIK
jgi:hypothetical protein